MAMRLKYQDKEDTLTNVINDAFSEFEDLATEMRDAFDNTPESLQQSAVGQAREEAADSLEQLDTVAAPDWAEGFKVKWTERVLTPSQARKRSRSDRRDEACGQLQACIETLDEIKEDAKQPQDMRDAAKDLRDELERAKDDADAVEFPGMYG